jgi:hypothetical protein
MAVFCQL